ncbi:MAG: hypothetical protein IBX69_10445, partial [Anaerolineales bacterium]|nr:hypothetical protein [Anaerolineales bacterium]
LAKFWLLFAGVLLFYAVSRQPFGNWWRVGWIFTLLGGLTSIYFLAGHDWHADPTHFSWINTFGSAWREMFPVTIHSRLTDYAAAGILAITIPFAISLWPYTKKSNSKRLILIATGLIIAFGLLMTGERSAWFVLSLAFIPWLMWEVAQKLGRNNREEIIHRFSRLMRLIGLLLLVLVFSYGLIAAIQTQGVPGLGSLFDRMVFVGNTLDLIGDFLFTGGGLRAFEGLYSHYIFAIPHVLASYSLNLFLDVTLEQGIFAGLSLVLILFGSIWIARKPYTQFHGVGDLLKWAALTGLIFMIVHGLVDNSFYGDRGTPFLFVLPGMVMMLSSNSEVLQKAKKGSNFIDFRRQSLALRVLIFLFAVTGLLAVILMAGEKLLARVYVNLASVEMARIELRDFPRNEWVYSSDVHLMADSVELMRRALHIDPNLHASYHRLGLIALKQHDFSLALEHLERAYDLHPTHRGIQKNLGYSFVWVGNYPRAKELLIDLPETHLELGNYSHFWRLNSRPDLADNALFMVAELAGSRTQ